MKLEKPADGTYYVCLEDDGTEVGYLVPTGALPKSKQVPFWLLPKGIIIKREITTLFSEEDEKRHIENVCVSVPWLTP